MQYLGPRVGVLLDLHEEEVGLALLLADAHIHRRDDLPIDI